jgi:hypothetical protein
MISAACRPAPDEVDPHLSKVQLGVIDGMIVRGHMHCSLPSGPVREPEVRQASRTQLVPTQHCRLDRIVELTVVFLS